MLESLMFLFPCARYPFNFEVSLLPFLLVMP